MVGKLNRQLSLTPYPANNPAKIRHHRRFKQYIEVCQWKHRRIADLNHYLYKEDGDASPITVYRYWKNNNHNNPLSFSGLFDRINGIIAKLQACQNRADYLPCLEAIQNLLSQKSKLDSEPREILLDITKDMLDQLNASEESSTDINVAIDQANFVFVKYKLQAELKKDLKDYTNSRRSSFSYHYANHYDGLKAVANAPIGLFSFVKHRTSKFLGAEAYATVSDQNKKLLNTLDAFLTQGLAEYTEPRELTEFYTTFIELCSAARLGAQDWALKTHIDTIQKKIVDRFKLFEEKSQYTNSDNRMCFNSMQLIRIKIGLLSNFYYFDQEFEQAIHSDLQQILSDPNQRYQYFTSKELLELLKKTEKTANQSDQSNNKLTNQTVQSRHESLQEKLGNSQDKGKYCKQIIQYFKNKNAEKTEKLKKLTKQKKDSKSSGKNLEIFKQRLTLKLSSTFNAYHVLASDLISGKPTERDEYQNEIYKLARGAHEYAGIAFQLTTTLYNAVNPENNPGDEISKQLTTTTDIQNLVNAVVQNLSAMYHSPIEKIKKDAVNQFADATYERIMHHIKNNGLPKATNIEELAEKLAIEVFRSPLAHTYYEIFTTKLLNKDNQEKPLADYFSKPIIVLKSGDDYLCCQHRLSDYQSFGYVFMEMSRKEFQTQFPGYNDRENKEAQNTCKTKINKIREDVNTENLSAKVTKLERENKQLKERIEQIESKFEARISALEQPLREFSEEKQVNTSLTSKS